MNAVIGFVIGLFVGVTIGVIVAAMISAGKRYDEWSEQYWDDSESKE